MKTEAREEAITLRLEGHSINDISKKLGVALSSVSLWVRHIKQPEKFTTEYRLKEREKRLNLLRIEREKNKRVRKEKILSGAGYWMIPVPEGYTGKVYSIGYIYEHRYVLENKLGRNLKKNEVAHHINENTLDNRPENLELKTKKIHDSDHKRSIGVEMAKLKCPNCERIFDIPKRSTFLINGNLYTTCSRSCRGHFSREIQLKGMTSIIQEKISQNLINIYRLMPS